MSDVIFVSWKEQLEYIESNAFAGGYYSYERARSEMWEGLRSKHGRYAEFDMQEIPVEILDPFIEWLEKEEEE